MIAKKSLFAMSIVCALAAINAADAAAAKTAKKQAAIQSGTTVRTKVEASGLYSQECYDAYYSCMDQFCITENISGGSCSCSDTNAKFEKEYREILAKMQEAERISTVEVEKVKAGANADIIFTGGRKYDEDGNLLGLGQMSAADKKAERRANLLASLTSGDSDDDDDEDIWGSEIDDLFSKTGDDLRKAAQRLCEEQIEEKEACTPNDMAFLRQVYARQITADCKAFENSIAKQKAEADLAMANAEADVRGALKESLASANKYNLGECMVEFKKCMMTDDACGKDWSNCVFTVASENMQNNQATSVAGTTVATVNTYDITESTMGILNSKRFICERVLDQCVVVRDEVWPAFLREAAPTIRVAESAVESKFRQSCLTKISDCIQTACRDDIVGKGTATMDACLARPDMARSFCKVEIDPCERMEPQIWSYVTDKLAAMRVDACTEEVKNCFTAETRCGKNFENCIGMDYQYIHDICPIDTLVVCKANRPGFTMDDLDSMLMGLYLNIDNAALEQCENLVDAKMAELCGSTTDCNKFAADDTLGTGSLRSQKDGDVYRVTGMISFGSIKMGDATGITDQGEDSSKRLGPGEIGVREYIAKVRQNNAGIKNADGIITSIEEELNNIAGTINRTIQLIEQDPEIQFCINGRDLSQITGNKNQKTKARFPNLLTQTKMIIASSALRKAQDNYNNKLNDEIAKATQNASIDLAQYMCQKVAEHGSTGGMEDIAKSSQLVPPFAISYDVGSGLTAADLVKGGAGVISMGGAKFNNKGYLGNFNAETGGVSKEITAVFSRETRTCHICTTTMTQSCKTKGSKSWFHNNRNVDCTTQSSDEKCEDIQM